MVLSSFYLASGAVLVILLVLVGFNQATYVRGRVAMARELGAFLDDVVVPDREHCTGTWRGMPVSIALNPYSIDYQVQLPDAAVPYRELVARYAGVDLVARMRALELGIDGRDRLVGSTARENGLAESIITIEQRIGLAAEVRALRSHVPRQLLEALEGARSTIEVDELLMALTRYYPDAVETAEAIEVAMARDPQVPSRIRERAARWLGGALRTSAAR